MKDKSKEIWALIVLTLLCCFIGGGFLAGLIWVIKRFFEVYDLGIWGL